MSDTTKLRGAFVGAVADIFASLPSRAATLETDCVAPLPLPRAATNAPNAVAPPLRVEWPFRRSYETAPKVVCWLLYKGGTASADPTLKRIRPSAIAVTEKGATVSVATELTAEELRKTALYWVAFTTPKTNPFLTATLQKIFSHPASFPKSLESSVEECTKACDINEGDHTGQTLLHAASCSGNTALISWLLARGASVDARDEHGWTPMLAAVSSVQPEAAMQLLASGANASATCERGMTALHVLCRWPQYSRKQVLLARQITATGMPVNALNDAGETPLLYLCRKREHSSVPFATSLLELGADPSIADSTGMAPLHVAALGDNVPLTELLVSRGADITAGSPQGTAMAIALKRKCEAVVAALSVAIQLPAAAVSRVLWELPPYDVQRAGAVSRLFLRVSRTVLSDPHYWKLRCGLPREILSSLQQLRSSQGASFNGTVVGRLRGYTEGLHEMMLSPDELAEAKPVARMLLTVAGQQDQCTAFVRAFCGETDRASVRRPSSVSARMRIGTPSSSDSPGSFQSAIAGSSVDSRASHEYGSPARSAATATSPQGDDTADASEQHGGDEGEEDDGDESQQAAGDEPAPNTPFYRKILARLSGQIVELFLFVLAVGTGKPKAEDIPFKQFYRLSAACIALADLSLDTKPAVDGTRRAIDTWRLVCGDGKANAILVLGINADTAKSPIAQRTVSQLAIEQGMLYSPVTTAATDENDPTIEELVKVACDVGAEHKPLPKSAVAEGTPQVAGSPVQTSPLAAGGTVSPPSSPSKSPNRNGDCVVS